MKGFLVILACLAGVACNRLEHRMVGHVPCVVVVDVAGQPQAIDCDWVEAHKPIVLPVTPEVP